MGHVEAAVLGSLAQRGLQELDEFGGVGGVGPRRRDFAARPHERAALSRRVVIKHQDLQESIKIQFSLIHTALLGTYIGAKQLNINKKLQLCKQFYIFSIY